MSFNGSPSHSPNFNRHRDDRGYQNQDYQDQQNSEYFNQVVNNQFRHPQQNYQPLSDTSSDEFSPQLYYLERKENIQFSDIFFKRLYNYFQKKGYYCIILSQVCYILTILFSIIFSTFVSVCVDWKGIHNGDKKTLLSAIYPKCQPDDGHNPLILFFFSIFFIWWVFVVVYSINYIYNMYTIRRFYIERLEILDHTFKNMSWENIVEKLKNKVEFADLHYITNRIMRYDNYLIAMVNRDTFNFNKMRYMTFTKILEWNLHKCIAASLFTDDGILMKNVMFSAHTDDFCEQLTKNFKILGVLNVIFAPFVMTALSVYFIYKYVSEYHKNPKVISIYSFTPLTKWKLRDFNELEHVYSKRFNKAHPIILKYLGQFVNEPVNILFKFLSFLLGSTLIILVTVSFFNSDMIVSLFKVEQPIIFYVGILSGLYVFVNNNIYEDTNAGEPDDTFNELVDILHYVPKEWESLNTFQRYYEIKKLFKYNWLNFINEIVSIVYVPYLLYFWLPKQSKNIVNFFKENSVHVDKLDIICSSALFKNIRYKAGPSYSAMIESDHMQKKMNQSISNFNNAYPNWSNDLISVHEQSVYQSNQNHENYSDSFYNQDHHPLSPPIQSHTHETISHNETSMQFHSPNSPGSPDSIPNSPVSTDTVKLSNSMYFDRPKNPEPPFQVAHSVPERNEFEKYQQQRQNERRMYYEEQESNFTRDPMDYPMGQMDYPMNHVLDI